MNSQIPDEHGNEGSWKEIRLRMSGGVFALRTYVCIEKTYAGNPGCISMYNNRPEKYLFIIFTFFKKMNRKFKNSFR